MEDCQHLRVVQIGYGVQPNRSGSNIHKRSGAIAPVDLISDGDPYALRKVITIPELDDTVCFLRVLLPYLGSGTFLMALESPSVSPSAFGTRFTKNWPNEPGAMAMLANNSEIIAVDSRSQSKPVQCSHEEPRARA